MKNLPSTITEVEAERCEKVDNPILRTLSSFKFSTTQFKKLNHSKDVIETLKRPLTDILKKPTGRSSEEAHKKGFTRLNPLLRPKLSPFPNSSVEKAIKKSLRSFEHLSNASSTFKFRSMKPNSANPQPKRQSAVDDKSPIDKALLKMELARESLFDSGLKTRVGNDSQESAELKKDSGSEWLRDTMSRSEGMANSFKEKQTGKQSNFKVFKMSKTFGKNDGTVVGKRFKELGKGTVQLLKEIGLMR